MIISKTPKNYKQTHFLCVMQTFSAPPHLVRKWSCFTQNIYPGLRIWQKIETAASVNKVNFFINNTLLIHKEKMTSTHALYNGIFISDQLGANPWLQNLSLRSTFTGPSRARTNSYDFHKSSFWHLRPSTLRKSLSLVGAIKFVNIHSFLGVTVDYI